MYDLPRATALSVRLASTKEKHQDYQRTLELARMYKAFVTGEDLDYMIQRFDRRESPADFEMVKRIVQFTSKPVTASLMKPAAKVVSVRPVVDRVDYGRENDEKAGELRERLATFYGGDDVDAYMGTLVEPSYTDPNAFVVLTFDPFDFRREEPTVYPVHVPCENVWSFEYLNSELQYLWLAYKIKYITKAAVIGLDGTVVTPAETADGMRFVMYVDNHHIVYEQVAKDRAPTGPKGVIVDLQGNPVNPEAVTFSAGPSEPLYYFRVSDEVVDGVYFYEQKSGQVRPFRLRAGTHGVAHRRTCVNGWDEAVPYLKKGLKRDRESDLSIALHVFLQKIQYAPKCQEKGCNGGQTPDGLDCGTCKGSGKLTIATALDHMLLTMPKDPSQMFDLENLVHYVQMPIEIVKMLWDILKETRSDAFRAVYGSDPFTQGNVGKTYEEVLAMNEGMYDALQPFGKWWSKSRSTLIRVYAAYMDKAENLVVVHKLPRSFGFETVATVFGAMKGASEAGASKAITANLNSTAEDILFRDDPEKLKKVKTQSRFDPFPGMTTDVIAGLISGGKTTEESALMWTESAKVFRMAEAKYTGDKTFYDQPEKKQDEVIAEILKTLLEEQKAAKAEAMPQFDPLTGEDGTGEGVPAGEQGDNEQGGGATGPVRGERGGTYWIRADGTRQYNEPR